MMKLIALLLLLVACDRFESVDKKDPSDPGADRVQALIDEYGVMLAKAESMRDANGWLDGEGCDGMIWSGRYAAAPGVTGVNIFAAEDQDTPGKFHRRPSPPCWTQGAGDQGSKSTWSRDMAICGLIPWAWQTGNLAALERHAKHGKSKNWQMGDPLSDGRTIYTPQVIGLLYQAIWGLGGEDNPSRGWPSLYPEGLQDYEAHLQVCSIWLRGEVANTTGQPQDKPSPHELSLTQISAVMFDRLQEHYNREPHDPFYAYVLGMYNGDMTPAIDACLAGTVADYVRCDAQDECVMAHRVFSCGMTLKHLGKL